jgi:cell division protein FtsL
MSYKDILKKQIRELEEKIASATTEKDELQKQLNKLRIAEFEENIVEDNNQQLLKG